MAPSARPLAPLLVLALLGSACTATPSSDTGQVSSDESATTAGPTASEIESFLAAPSTDSAKALAESMVASGDLRWVPWLLDLHRLAVSNLVDAVVSDGLATLSGLGQTSGRLEDFQVFGQWAQTTEIDPGEGYRDWKLGLYGRLDDEYLSLLDQVPSDLLLSQIHWGGVPRGGIPELNNPERVPGREATWMVADEVVFGVEVDGISVAYPVRILGHHELANDVIGQIPVSVVYCTLCRTALLFDRRIDGGDSVGAADGGDELVLGFETSGLLWSSNKIMVDQETDTLWQHLSGTAIGGALVDTQLVQLPIVTTTWADWVASNPDTETLAIPTELFFPNIPEGLPVRYDYRPGAAYTEYYAGDSVWFPILETPDDLALKTEVIGLSVGDDHLAVPVERLAAAGSQTISVGGESIRLEPTPAGARAFDRSGRQLAVSQSFWFAWYGQHPDTEIWPGP